jgi:hypothetical protein
MGLNETPKGKLAAYLKGDLGVARRHLARILGGELPFSGQVVREINRSVEDCVERIERDMQPMSQDEIRQWCEDNLFGPREVQGIKIPLNHTQQVVQNIAVEIIEKWEASKR